MSGERITPYDHSCTIGQRIDEIVATGANVHIEMMDEGIAWMQIGDDIYTIYVERGQLFIAWRDNEADLSS